MQIHIPKFVFEGTSDASSNDQGIKFGGLPDGLPPDLWPICTECNVPLTFLFQMKDHSKASFFGKRRKSTLSFPM